MSTTYKFLTAILGVFTAASLISCSGNPSSLPIPAAVTISVSSPVNTVQAGNTVQLSASVSNTSNNSIVWTVEGVPGGNSMFGTITTSGLYTAPSIPPNPPMVTITGAAAANTSVLQTTSLTITPPPPPVAVTISPKAITVQVANPQSFTATVSNSNDTSVTWQVAGVQGGNSIVGTISTSGVYTAPAAVPSPSTVAVTAVSNADPTKSDSATVTISPAPAVVVAVTPSNADLQAGVGSTFQFNATVMNTNNMSVTWEVNGTAGGDMTEGTITSSGLYTAPSAVPSNPVVTITAVSVADPNVSGNATVTLFSGPPPIAVAISPPTATVGVGATQQFTATVTNATNTSVTWYVNSVQGGNMTFGAVTSTGLYTAPAVVPSPASVVVTAVANADNKTSASATVTIGSAITVTVAPAAMSLFLSQSQQFVATVSNSSNQNVLWDIPSCSVPNTCGTVTTSGLYTAPAAIPVPNPVSVRATSLADPTKSGSSTVTVTPVPTPTVTISPPGASISPAGSQVFTATVSYDPLMQGVTWTLTCVTDGDDGDGDCTNDNPPPPGDSDGDEKIYLTAVSPVSVTVNAAIASSHSVVTLTATSVAKSTGGTHGSQNVTITVP